MAIDDTYDGRRPTFGIGGNRRGFRSKPGAPMATPWLNNGAVGSSSSLTPRSNWDSAFRNTASNGFGADGTNPLYQSSFPTPSIASPSGQAGADMQSTDFAQGEDQIAQLGGVNPLMDNGTHQQAWSQPKPRATQNPLAGGYEAGNPLDILSKYQTPDTTASMFQAPGKKNPFGWFKSFDQNG